MADQPQDAAVSSSADSAIRPAKPLALGGGGQQELPFALVYGQAYTEMPQDLYIPPEALEVFLEAFEGPLCHAGRDQVAFAVAATRTRR